MEGGEMKDNKWQITIEVSEMFEMHYTELGMEKHIRNEIIDALDGCHLEVKTLKVKKLEDKK